MNIDIFAIQFLQSFRNPIFDFLALFLSYLFSSLVWLLFFVIDFIVGLFKKIKRLLLLSYSIFINFVIVAGLKHLVMRQRPDYLLNLPMAPHTVYSFPSGHTAMAFLFAVMVGSYYPKYKWWLIALAFIVGLSRIYIGAHYLSDVVAGALIGTGVGLFVLKYKDKFNSISEKLIKLLNSFH